jgi:hypothetical protein
MYAIGIAHLIDTRADTIADRLIEKLRSNGSYSTLRVVPAQELKRCMRDIYSHLAELSLTTSFSAFSQRKNACGNALNRNFCKKIRRKSLNHENCYHL